MATGSSGSGGVIGIFFIGKQGDFYSRKQNFISHIYGLVLKKTNTRKLYRTL